MAYGSDYPLMTDNTNLCSREYETRRLQMMADYRILDTPEEPAFDEIGIVGRLN
ncbi:MAG: hypothetical protein KGY54_13200 [Oleiphilaceae bacterium]|nr:hypothetical protein [Oleiphilaceae bacterium]